MPNGNGDALGQPRRPVHVSVKENWWTKGSLIVGLFALLASGLALYLTWSPMGEVEAMSPGSYAIIRQDTLGKPGFVATAEHLVLPVEWRNEKGTSVLVRRMELVVEKEGGGDQQVFYLVKEYPQVSGQAFSKDYDFKTSLVLEPHSVETRVLSFRSQNGDFRFEPNTGYEAAVRFVRDDRGESETMPPSGEPRWRFCTRATNDPNGWIRHGDVEWNWWAIHEDDGQGCVA